MLEKFKVFDSSILSHDKIGFQKPGYDLLLLTSSQKSDFSDLVRSQNNVARVLIHPFCHLHGIKNNHGIEVSLSDIVLQAIGKKEFSPLVLGEENKNVDETIEAFRILGFQNEVLYYRTERLSPTKWDDYKTDISASDALASIDVKDLIIGGQYLEFIRLIYHKRIFKRNRNSLTIYRLIKGLNDDFLREYIPHRCVGVFACNMRDSDNFNLVTLSQVSFPFSHPKLES